MSKITKYPFYRFRVGVRADFQDFVIVGERRGFHNMTLQVRFPAPKLVPKLSNC